MIMSKGRNGYELMGGSLIYKLMGVIFVLNLKIIRLLEVKYKMAKLVSFLYKLARRANDVETLASGNPKRIAKRGKNKVIGRKIMKKLLK